MSVSARTGVWGGLVVAAALAAAVAGSRWFEAPPDRPGRLTAPQAAGTAATPAALAIGAPPAATAASPAATAASPAATAASPAATAASPAALVASGAPTVVLSGVGVGVDGGNVAIVSVNQGPDALVRVGDAIAASTTVLRIDDASMTYRFAGTELRIFVKPRLPTATPALTPNAPPKPLPGFVTGAPAMARAPGVEPGSGNEAFRQAVEKKIQAIAAGR